MMNPMLEELNKLKASLVVANFAEQAAAQYKTDAAAILALARWTVCNKRNKEAIDESLAPKQTA